MSIFIDSCFFCLHKKILGLHELEVRNNDNHQTITIKPASKYQEMLHLDDNDALG